MNIPRNVNIAVKIYFCALGLSLIGGLFNYFLSENRPSFVFTIAILGVFYGLLIKLGLLIKSGINWARHVNTGITLISFLLVSIFGSVATTETGIGMSQVILYVNNIAAITVVLLLYTNSSNRWYNEVNA